MLQSKTDIDQVICLLSPLHIQVCLQNLSQIQAGNTVLHLPQVLVLDGGRGGEGGSTCHFLVSGGRVILFKDGAYFC